MFIKHINDLEIKTIVGGSITDVQGFKTSGIHCGLKRKRKDLGAIVCDVPASVAGVFTLNNIQAAPLRLTKAALQKRGECQVVIVNSGNANACTGKQGERDAATMQELAAAHFNVDVDLVAVSSTGVIGEPLPLEKIKAGMPALQVGKQTSDFAEAILTTDTVTKEVCMEVMIDQKPVRIAGVAKGSGMVHPNMATMLGFITTDAVIDSTALQQVLSKTTDNTFNCITVDGDTSTNDMVLALASHFAGNVALTNAHPQWDDSNTAFQLCAKALAKMIARDGEGATKLIEVQVKGAISDQEAGKVAKAVVGSDLVKTAVYGKDANWGRIICAIGYSQCFIDPDDIDIAIGPYVTLQQSEPKPANDEWISAYLSENETIVISVDLHVGTGTGKAWGCDLTYDYVRINAGYRT